MRSEDQVVRLGLTNRLGAINPIAPTSWSEAMIWCRMFEPLLGLNPHMLEIGVAEDTVMLASSFSSELLGEGEPEQRVVFELKPGVLWHDGEPFTADDVAFTFLSLLGTHGQDIALRSESTEVLADALANEVPIPSWVDLIDALHHIEIEDDLNLTVYLTRRTRYAHSWFGDVPMIPMHVWRHLGPSFLEPTYQGVSGLHRIVDWARPSGGDGFSPWNGLVGTGPFRWIPDPERDPLTEGGALEAFEHYHFARGAA